MRIGLDIMGGDYAPAAPLDGVAMAIKSLPEGAKLVLFGDKGIITEFAEKNNLPKDKYEITGTTQVIEMGESPTKAMSTKPDSSILVGLKNLASKNLDIFISAGNTGAVYVGALYTVKAIEGVLRPAITTVIPKENGGHGVILDIGANADCKPEVLYQFGVLGYIYAKYVMGITTPKVGLLNIGSEPEKGNLATQAAYQLLEANDRFEFVGNVEGYDLFNDKADVVVTDGFTGNIVLKTAETIYGIMKKRGIKDEYFSRYDYETYGGTPILGVNKPVMIAHGVSTPEAFSKMIDLAIHIVQSKFIEKIKQAFELEPTR
jgi:glycerol-3-phosphate acyltransferase PlsX